MYRCIGIGVGLGLGTGTSMRRCTATGGRVGMIRRLAFPAPHMAEWGGGGGGARNARGAAKAARPQPPPQDTKTLQNPEPRPETVL